MAPRRVLLKLSGEAFADAELGYGIDPATVRRVASEVGEAIAQGVEVAIVVGGGNIFRGVSSAAAGMDQASADYMGMLATAIMPWLCVMRWKKRAWKLACNRRSRCSNLPSLTFDCEPFAILKRGASSFSRLALAIRSSPRTRLQRCERPRSERTSSLKQPWLTASTTLIPISTPTPSSSRRSDIWTFSLGGLT